MPDYDIIVSKRIDDPGYRWRLRDGRTGVIDYDKVQTLIDALTADNPDSVKCEFCGVAIRWNPEPPPNRTNWEHVPVRDDVATCSAPTPSSTDKSTEASTTATCKHCGRSIARENGAWVDTNATGDDAMWRETCDAHDTFTAEHEPEESQ